MSSPDQQSPSGPSWGPPNPVPPPGWTQPPAPRAGLPKAAKITLGIIGGLVIIGGCSAVVAGPNGTGGATAAAGGSSPAPGPTVTVTRTVTAPPAPAVTATVTATVTEPAAVQAPAQQPAAAPGDTVAGSGTYLVGDDIQPGTYKTAGPGSLGMCYWERAKDSSGGFESIIANDNLTGQGVVTIKSSDKVFKTEGCQAWVKSK
ncbi:hypothetical protein [Kitasatospora sp. NBC_00315]|uniref:hypothetical protein n=1 Tax=Kitasatospora sp. NBC_00315 TaxID=2975963 RepID=UPI00324B21BC